VDKTIECIEIDFVALQYVYEHMRLIYRGIFFLFFCSLCSSLFDLPLFVSLCFLSAWETKDQFDYIEWENLYACRSITFNCENIFDHVW